jgi:MFS family permease
VRVAELVRGRFEEFVCRPWFETAVIAFFALWTLASLAQIVGLIFYADTDLPAGHVVTLGEDITNDPLRDGELTFIQWAALASSAVATVFAIAGLYRAKVGRRAGALAMFERALLVSIFFTQVFAFVYSQFAAVFALLFDLVLFMALRAILSNELEQEALRRAGIEEPRVTQPASAARAQPV